MLQDVLWDILEQILSHCSVSDIQNLACTCSKFNNRLRGVLWKVIKVRKCKQINDKILEKFIHTKELDIRFERKVCTRSYEAEENIICKEIIEHCNTQGLMVLKLSSFPKDVHCLIVKFINLIELDLWDSNMDDSNLFLVSETLLRLKVLSLRETNVSVDGLAYLQKLSLLEDLYISGGSYKPVESRISEEGFCHLGKLTTLKKLHISSWQEITHMGVSYLERLKLESLKIGCCWVNDTSYSHIGKMVTLKVLLISGWGAINDAGVSFLTALTLLEELEIHAVMTDVGMDCLRHLTNLEKLKISGGNFISDTGLLYISKMASLQYLSIESYVMTDTGVIALASLPSLQTLDLHCPYGRVCEDGIDFLQKKHEERHPSVKLKIFVEFYDEYYDEEDYY